MPRTALRMPKMSMTMEEGELTSWRVGVGDVVGEGDVVCEVLTDKVDMEVEAPARGTVVEIEVDEGATVPVGTPLAWIETESDSLIDDLFGPTDAAEAVTPAEPAAAAPPAAPPAAAPPAPAPPAPPAAQIAGRTAADRRASSHDPGLAEGAPVAAAGTVPAMPGARRLAAERGLDLRSVAGTGPGGAVMQRDVEAALAAAPAPGVPAPAVPAAPHLTPTPAPVPAQIAGESAADRRVSSCDPGAVEAALRSAAAATRAGEDDVRATVLWRDVALRPGTTTDEVAVVARALGGLAAALAALGPVGVREQPRVGVRVGSAAGPVTLTVPGAHALDTATLADLVGTALAQAREGRVDVAFLAPADAVVAVVPDADRALVPVVAPAAVAVAVGAATDRVVPVGEGIGVRTVVTTSATGRGWAAGAEVLGPLLALVTGRLAG